MRINAAVIGSPISHSLSPEIFAFLSRRAPGFELKYQATEVKPSNLTTCLFEFSQDPFFVGCNVTVPHKESALDAADMVSPHARAAGAANVLHLQNQKWTAHNTDVYGIGESLTEAGVQIYEADILVLGAGGAARAAGVAAGMDRARRVHFLNRTYERAANIVSELAPQFPKCDFYALRDVNELQNPALSYTIVIQSTTLGMRGIRIDAKSEFKPMFDLIQGKPFGFDLIYRPETTEFITQCRERQWSCMNGLNMLAHQAIGTWNIWFPKHELPKGTSSELISHLRTHLQKLDELQSESAFSASRQGTGSRS